MNLRPQRSTPPDINLAPLIDVVFLLLIFFMVTTTFRDEVGIKVQLPQAQGETVSRARPLVLTIDAEGHFYLPDRRVPDQRPETLRRVLAEAVAAFRGQADAGTDAPGAAAGPAVAPPAEMPLIIEADARTPHQAVMTALDVSSQLGLRRVSFAASRGATVP